MQKKSFSLISAVFFLFSLVSCTGTSSFKLYIPGGESESLLTSKKDGASAFALTKKQKEEIKKYVAENGDGALLLQITTKKAPKSPEKYTEVLGFLSEENISFNQTIASVPDHKPVIIWDSVSMASSTFAVVYSFGRDQPLPEGFYIRSASAIKINSAQITKAAAGFDYRGEVPLYAFSYNGGYLVKDSKKIDLSGLPSSFISETSDKGLMPLLTINFASGDDTSEVQTSALPVKITVGGEKITLRNPKGDSTSVILPAASLKSPYSTLEVTENSEQIASILVSAGDSSLLASASTMKNCSILPIKVDPGLILNWPKENWRSRDYELYEWDRFENVLLFDFADYSVQDDFLRRLAYFTEKKGFRGRLVPDSELEGKHGYNAHDYSAESLAKFFSEANRTRFSLNRRELLLKEILVANSIIKENEDGTVEPLKGALISISKECPSYNRSALLAHEGWHGIFFTDEDFRNVSASLYYTMDRISLNFLTEYFGAYDSLSYDTSDDYLMKNELMAYMLQRPVSECGPYFVRIANWRLMQSNFKNDSDYIISTNGEGFTACAELFDQYVEERWNLAAGRIGLISR